MDLGTAARRALLLSRRRVVQAFKHVGVGTFIVSHPKCGRTWLRLMIGKALCDHYGLDPSDMLNLHITSVNAGLTKMHLTHDGTSAADRIPYRRLPADKGGFAGKRVLFLARDPKDVMASFYFHTTHRMHPGYRFHGSASEFIRDDSLGIRKLLTFYRIWNENRQVPSAFLPLHYEDMHRDAARCLRAALDFIGAADVPDSTVANAVAFGDIRNMRKLETANRFKSRAMKLRADGQVGALKVRRGKVGGHREDFSAADIAYLDATIAELGNPFA
jgi:hypothetical protein